MVKEGMTSDVFFADQYCYINDINRYHAVCYGLLNARKIFEKTFGFQYRWQLQQEAKSVQAALVAGKSILDTDFPKDPYHVVWLLNERLIDCFLIGTFFEIVAKAFLLDKGFVVHVLEKKSKDKNLKNLANNQYKTPVKITELLQYDHFQDYNNNGRNGLECFCSYKRDPLCA